MLNASEIFGKPEIKPLGDRNLCRFEIRTVCNGLRSLSQFLAAFRLRGRINALATLFARSGVCAERITSLLKTVGALANAAVALCGAGVSLAGHYEFPPLLLILMIAKIHHANWNPHLFLFLNFYLFQNPLFQNTHMSD